MRDTTTYPDVVDLPNAEAPQIRVVFFTPGEDVPSSATLHQVRWNGEVNLDVLELLTQNGRWNTYESAVQAAVDAAKKYFTA